MKSAGGLDWRKIAAVDITTFAESISGNERYLDEIATLLSSFSAEAEFVSTAQRCSVHVH